MPRHETRRFFERVRVQRAITGLGGYLFAQGNQKMTQADAAVGNGRNTGLGRMHFERVGRAAQRKKSGIIVRVPTSDAFGRQR